MSQEFFRKTTKQDHFLKMAILRQIVIRDQSRFFINKLLENNADPDNLYYDMITNIVSMNIYPQVALILARHSKFKINSRGGTAGNIALFLEQLISILLDSLPKMYLFNDGSSERISMIIKKVEGNIETEFDPIRVSTQVYVFLLDIIRFFPKTTMTISNNHIFISPDVGMRPVKDSTHRLNVDLN